MKTRTFCYKKQKEKKRKNGYRNTDCSLKDLEEFPVVSLLSFEHNSVVIVNYQFNREYVYLFRLL